MKNISTVEDLSQIAPSISNEFILVKVVAPPTATFLSRKSRY